MEVLLTYDYPGNVREMENILEHALIICQSEVIEKKHLPPHLFDRHGRKIQAAAAAASLDPDSREERERILSMLTKQRWNRGQTAQALHMDRSTLWRKMKRYGIDIV